MYTSKTKMLNSDLNKSLKKASTELDGKADYASDNSGIAPPFAVKSSNYGDTTAQSVILDDSFQEVTDHKRSRRQDKQMAKEKIQEDKVTKKFTNMQKPKSKNVAPVMQPNDTEEYTEEGEQTTSFENT